MSGEPDPCIKDKMAEEQDVQSSQEEVQVTVEPEDQNVCRICLGGERYFSRMVSPCRCSGSMGFVHQDCLRKLVLKTKSMQCGICKVEFKARPAGEVMSRKELAFLFLINLKASMCDVIETSWSSWGFQTLTLIFVLCTLFLSTLSLILCRTGLSRLSLVNAEIAIATAGMGFAMVNAVGRCILRVSYNGNKCSRTRNQALGTMSIQLLVFGGLSSVLFIFLHNTSNSICIIYFVMQLYPLLPMGFPMWCLLCSVQQRTLTTVTFEDHPKPEADSALATHVTLLLPVSKDQVAPQETHVTICPGPATDVETGLAGEEGH